MKRRQVRAKRGSENRTQLTITSRVQQAFGILHFTPDTQLFKENWAQVSVCSSPEDFEKRLTRFLPLRKLVAEGMNSLLHPDFFSVESASSTIIELHYGTTILGCIKDANKDMQISYLYAMSDLVDVDDAGVHTRKHALTSRSRSG